jgi:hypothetical protein
VRLICRRKEEEEIILGKFYLLSGDLVIHTIPMYHFLLSMSKPFTNICNCYERNMEVWLFRNIPQKY